MSGRRAIVCDDDPLIATVASVILRRAGFDVVATPTSGAELGRALGSAPGSSAPDVIVLDQMVPDMAGDQLVGLVKAAAPACQIIVFSGSAEGAGGGSGDVFARVAKRGTTELEAAVSRAAEALGASRIPTP